MIAACCGTILLWALPGGCRLMKRWFPTEIGDIRCCLVCRNIFVTNRRASPRVGGDEGNHSRGRCWYAALSSYPGGQQATPAGLRQADDLLPIDDLDARRHPPNPRHHDTGGSPPVRGATQGRQPMGLVDRLCGAAAAGGARA